MSNLTKQYTPKEISKLLVQCAEGAKAAEKVAKEISYFKYEETLINSAIHYLHHFYADADLRSQDQEYNEHMKKKLFSYASQLNDL